MGITANCLTVLRILSAAALCCFPPLGAGFFVFYLLGGLSDALDGFVARKTHTESVFGAKLDTAADGVFFLLCLIRLFHLLALPVRQWVLICLIAAWKLFGTVYSLRRYRHLPVTHTVLNKVTGAALYLLPFTLPLIPPRFTVPFLCILAMTAAGHEWNLILRGESRK